MQLINVMDDYQQTPQLLIALNLDDSTKHHKLYKGLNLRNINKNQNHIKICLYKNIY